ncbi:MAG TPA: sigma-70 family RNA polymerase sigma factor [Planctomycetota bacterium]
MADHPMDPALAGDLSEHARALRALAQQLVGDQCADDLVQDTTLTALRWPPERREGIGAWLRQVLRRLASNHRRAAARRARHERQASPPAVQDTAARVAEQHELVQRVTQALLALPEPYHGTLLLRFFQDLTPTEIAHATGAPLATIKSRLQRGITLLRERLDESPGSKDWRAGMAAAFGLRDVLQPGVVAAASACVTGGVLMGTAMKLTAAALATALVVAAWIVWNPGPPAGTRDAVRDPAKPAPVVAAASNTDVRAPVVGEQPVRQAAPAPVSAGTQPLATLRGRCVDERGLPLAGVLVKLTSNARSNELLDAWTKDHDAPAKLGESLTSGNDGTFVFRFWPAPPMQHFLRLQCDGRALLSGRVEGGGEMVAGKERDLGDLCLPAGSTIRGRLRDTKGAPVAGAEVHFVAQTPPVDGIRVHERANARTGDDGRFATWIPVPPGEYGVRAGDARAISASGPALDAKVTPARVSLGGGVPFPEVELVIDRAPARPTIRGVVVDERDQPVADANVTIVGYDWGPTPSKGVVKTDANGAFTLPGSERSPDKVTLRALKRGFEDTLAPEPVAWGSPDVRLVLRRALAVEVSVVAADGGVPVEQFQVRIVSPGRVGVDFGVRARGRHPGGRVVVDGVLRGDWTVIVEPAGDEFAPVTLAPVHVADPGPVRVTVQLQRAIAQSVRVRTAAGAPVAGTRVELALMRDGVPTIDTYAHSLTSTLWLQPGVALLQDQGVTGADGCVRVRGPANTPLALFVRGPGHVPAIEPAVVLDATRTIEVTVGTGASLAGRASPAEAIAELRTLAGLPEQGAVGATKKGLLPGIRLHRNADGRTSYWPDFPATIGDDGAFRIDGVPPGRWEVLATWFEPAPGRDGACIGQSAPVAAVELRDGATMELDVDLSALLPGEIDGLVLHNGTPAAQRQIQFDLQGKAPSYACFATTDDAGRFRLRARGGDYIVSGHTDRTRLSADERAHVVKGQTATRTFTLQSGTLCCRVIDDQGNPVRGVRVDMLQEGPEPRHWTWLARTDDNGITLVEVAIAPVQLAVLPERLQDPAAQQARLAQGEDAFASERLQLGRFTATPGKTTELELRLPAAWRR